MQIRRLSENQGTKLADLLGQVVALQADGYMPELTTRINGEDVTAKNVLRARVWVYDPSTETAVSRGTTLVFHQVIAQELSGSPDSAIVGRLVRQPSKQDPDRDYLTLSDDGIDWAKLEKAFSEL